MSQNLETILQNSGMIEVGMRSDTLVWRQHVGQFRYLHNEGRIKIGCPGMADLGLIVACKITPDMVGRTVGIAVNAEYKTYAKNSKQSEQQKLWEIAFTSRGGIYKICKSSSDLISLVENVKNGHW